MTSNGVSLNYCYIYIFLMHTLFYSMYWADGPDDFYRRSDYKDLLPSRPRIIDPANPFGKVVDSTRKILNPH